MPTTTVPETVNPNRTSAVINSDGSRVSPRFLHLELAHLCARNLNEQQGMGGLTVKSRPFGLQNGTLRAYSRELGWLEMARTRELEFSRLCSRWSRSCAMLSANASLTPAEWATKSEQDQQSLLQQVIGAAFVLDGDSTRESCIKFLERHRAA